MTASGGLVLVVIHSGDNSLNTNHIVVKCYTEFGNIIFIFL